MSSAIYGAVLLQDNFESYPLYSWPSSTWEPDGNADSDSSNNRIELDPMNASNHVLKLYGVLGASWGALAYGSCNFTSSFTIESRIYNGSESLSGAHPERGNLSLRYGTYWYAPTNPCRSLILFKGDGTVTGTDGSVIMDSYETERWYDIKMQYDRVDDDITVHYWIDGTDIGSIQVNNVDMAKELSFDHYELTAQEGSVFFDDVIITPEPATILLLSLGGLILRKKH
jgi:hypothetical protein